MSSGAAFPMDLLHAEMVSYVKEAAGRRNKAKEEWKGIADTCVDASQIDKYNSLISQAFCYSNAETQLESIGFRVGFVIAERLSKEISRLNTELEVVKFICKDFWSTVFGKQVDNLRTNHQGVYVVQDNKFSTLASFAEGPQFVTESAMFLCFPSGLIRGALSNLNVNAIVTPTVESLPSVKFHIHIQQAQQAPTKSAS